MNLLCFPPRCTPVLYAALPCVNGRDNGRSSHCGSESKKRQLAVLLCAQFTAAGVRHGVVVQQRRQEHASMHLGKTSMGRPLLLQGDVVGPSISFTYGAGKIWAAITDERFNIGIDFSWSHEFSGDYPFDRVFHAEELLWAMEAARVIKQEAAAMVWSAKEAVVKALGCGFHFVEPRDVILHAVGQAADRYTFEIDLWRVVERGVRLPIGENIRLYALREGYGWLSFAIVARRHIQRHGTSF